MTAAGGDRAPRRDYGPAAGEPPPLVDPRRWGSLIGLAGGLLFIASYSSALGAVISAIVWVIGLGGVLAALFAHYVRPSALGPLSRPRPRPAALLAYAACVVGELALIALGSQALHAVGQDDVRPSLIAAVVGVHFLPFAWAFGEAMFFTLGGVVAGLGVVGLALGVLGVPNAAEALAVLAGLAMIAVIVRYAFGGWSRAPRPAQTGPA